MLGAFLGLNQNTIYNNNFSSDSSLTLSGTLYSDEELTTAFTLTGYTLTLRIFRDGSVSDAYNQTVDIVSASAGTWKKNVETNTLPQAGLYQVKIELTKSGTAITTLNREEILIIRGPHS